MGANVTLPPGVGPYCYRIHGMVYHTTSSVGQNSLNPGYADLYFMDSAQATNVRLHNQANAGCERLVMIALIIEHNKLFCRIVFKFFFKFLFLVFSFFVFCFNILRFLAGRCVKDR